MLAAALAYAARGWRVFPCHSIVHRPGPEGMAAHCTCGRACESPGKHPRIKGGLRSASSDPAQITAWWSKWPTANIAIATGPESDLTVTDLDGPQGAQELAQLLASAVHVPSTLIAQTGSGAHLYYKHSGERSSARGKVHIRGAGGYVIAPPSSHKSGRSYQWLNPGAAVLDLPEQLQAYADGGERESRPAADFAAFGAVPAHVAQMQHVGAFGGGAQHAVRGVAARALANQAPEWTAHEELRLRSAVNSIGANVGYDGFLRVGMALKALGWERGDGTDVGFDIWDQWCAKFPAFYNPATLEYKWTTFGGSSAYGGAVSIASIFKMAQEAGWDARQSMSQTELPNKINGNHSLSNLPVLANAATPFGGQELIHFPDVDKNGNPKNTTMNARAAIRMLNLDCRHDTFHDRFYIGGAPVGEWAGELTDNAVHKLRTVLHRFRPFGQDPGTIGAYDAAIQEGLEHAFDPVQDFLDGLTWDRVPRLKSWLADYLGADPTPLNESIGILALVAAVRRAREPGTKFDQIIVLEGREGTQKSSAIECLANAAGPGNYSDSTILTLDDRGQQEAVQGVWLYEIADLTGIGKAEIERVKAFASRTVDRARPAYGRSRQDRPRRCVFFATTNHDTYLKSQTGNRRFWPVRTGAIDLERLTADRAQLWAEAVALEESGMSLKLPMHLWVDAAELQDARREGDPWDDMAEDLAHQLLRRNSSNEMTALYRNLGPNGSCSELRISSRDILELHLKIAADRQTDNLAKRLAFTMRRAGWSGPQVFRDKGGRTVRGYVRRVTGVE